MQGLSRKGLHATAFEVAKVLMLLDPDDPMGAIFCIDYFALRSQNYRWLQVSLASNPLIAQISSVPYWATQAPSSVFSLQRRPWCPHSARADYTFANVKYLGAALMIVFFRAEIWERGCRGGRSIWNSR